MLNEALASSTVNTLGTALSGRLTPRSRTASLLRPDKLASVAIKLALPERIQVAPIHTPEVGDLVVVRVVREAPSYNQLELVSGRLARLVEGDLVVGALGNRRALKGFVGEVPSRLEAGDILHILNLGGVIGQLKGGLASLGRPTEVEYLGTVVDDSGVVNLNRTVLAPLSLPAKDIPLVMVAGTCMHAGKTQAAAELIRQLTRAGHKVAAAKLSGVACQRDLLAMQDNGAVATASFLDCGLPSTVDIDDIAPIARHIVAHLMHQDPDVIVVELGDGILGGYNVDTLLKDEGLAALRAALVFCAGDFVGVHGGLTLLKALGIGIDAVAGAATDSPMGVAFIAERFGLKAANALSDGATLHRYVEGAIGQWRRARTNKPRVD